MILHTDEWLALPNGMRYQGAVNPTTGNPDGLGIITVEDHNHFYVGEFCDGKRHGRGFLLNNEQWTATEEVWEAGSYDEVMATARFDNAGRVIHTDKVGKYVTKEVHHSEWRKECDGVWDNDQLVNPVSLDALKKEPWRWAKTAFCASNSCYCDASTSTQGCYDGSISEAAADGCYSFNGRAYITPYDDEHLLVCDRYGHVFLLGIEREYHYTLKSASMSQPQYRSFYLYCAEPNYEELFATCQYNELVATALASGNVMSTKAEAYFLRVFYFPEPIFMLSPETIELLRRAADEGRAQAQFAYARYLTIVAPHENAKVIAANYVLKAYEQGLSDAIAALAQAWEYGDMGEVDRSKAEDYLKEAYDKDSEFAIVLMSKRYIYNSNEAPTEDADFIPPMIEKCARAGVPSGILVHYLGAMQAALGKTDLARNYFIRATQMGVIKAWFELALLRATGEFCSLPVSDDYRKALQEGVEHHNYNCLTVLSLLEKQEYEELPKSEQTEERALEIVEQLKKSCEWGDSAAGLALGDIYLYGWLKQRVDRQEAWRWYCIAAARGEATACERKYMMVEAGFIDLPQEEFDKIAIDGARLGSEMLMAETIVISCEDRLQEYAHEIETYYESSFEDDDDDIDFDAFDEAELADFWDDDDELDDFLDDDDDDELDDDGRFDAWS